MDTEKAYERLDFRCYQWAIQEFQREITQGYPYLKSIASRHVQSWVVLFEDLNKEKQDILLRVLVKRRFQKVIADTGDPFTAEDAALLKQYERVLPTLPPKTPDPSKGDIKPIKVRRLASRIIERLNPVLGDQVEQFRGMGWSYLTPMGDWNIKTEVSIDYPKAPEVNYWHVIMRTDYKRPPQSRGHQPSYSFANSLGLGSNIWRVNYNYELESTVDSLATLCAHFIDAFPRLVEGLSIND